MTNLQTESYQASSYKLYMDALIAENHLNFDSLELYDKDELIADYIEEYLLDERAMPIPKATQMSINKVCSDLLLGFIAPHDAGEKIQEILRTSDIVAFIENDYDTTASNKIIDSLEDDEGLDSELLIADQSQRARSIKQENSYAGL